MRKSLLTLSVAAALGAPAIAQAQTAPAAPASPHTLTGNISLVSEYRFRGIDQTFGQPALQGGFDYAHSSGIYVGNWNSNVSEGAGFPGGNLEMDFYGGWKKSFGDFGLDIGAIYYYYPGTDASGFTNNGKTGNGKVNNKEVYIGGSWKFLSLKYFYSVDDYFSVPDTKGSNYVDLGFSYDLGSGWGVNAHYGVLKFKNVTNGDYNDWKLGVTKDINGWVLGAAYVDTDAKGDCGAAELYCFPNSIGTKTKDAGRSTVVLSVSKSF
jgi:uncharacterized protein (TIGR02001 family)